MIIELINRRPGGATLAVQHTSSGVDLPPEIDEDELATLPGYAPGSGLDDLEFLVVCLREWARRRGFTVKLSEPMPEPTGSDAVIY